MDGIILIDKPQGWTSFDVVNKLRRIIEQGGLNTTGKKRFPAGHTGTLDPMAAGLMVVVLGKYTKRAQEFSKLDKVYEVEMTLGATSTTGDVEGELTPVSDSRPAEEEVLQAIKQFEGEIEQIPPAYSAVKVNGQRAYKLARAGKEVKIEPRQVKIYTIGDVTYEYPQVTFMAHVSSGTYIRSLVQDIGEKLTTGAYMSDLNRTEVGAFALDDAVPMDGLTAETIYQNIKKVAEL